MSTLTAAGGLGIDFEDGRATVHYQDPDWLGPVGMTFGAAPAVDVEPGDIRDGADGVGRFRCLAVTPRSLHTGVGADVRAYADEPVLAFTLRATRSVQDLSTGRFAVPAVAWPACAAAHRRDGGLPAGTLAFGHQYTEFAFPTHTDASLTAWPLWPWRPAVVEPLLLIAPDGRTLLIAPGDCFHDQVVAVASDPRDHDFGLRAGWHGDLARIPCGFASTMLVLADETPRRAIACYGRCLRRLHGDVGLGLADDTLGARVSYWTDNGSAYWYRTEPGLDAAATVAGAVADAEARGVPIGAVQLDSWWYPHATLRPFDTAEWEVPPTGLLQWEPRPDAMPNGMAAFRAAVGNRPLVVHCRHLSADSPYVDDVEVWCDGDRAHPVGPELYERYLDQCVAWGAETFEHDWLIECFLGVRDLRSVPGRAAEWQRGIDRALALRGLTAQWSMASPADLFETVALERVTSVRTSGDHGYVLGPGWLWTWLLFTSALARALGVAPFKDVFLSSGERGSVVPQMEALLAALSTGPVGIGDRRGTADAAAVRPTCRADSVIVRPDVPVAALDGCYRAHPIDGAHLLFGSAHTSHEAGLWSYVLAANAHDDDAAIAGHLTLADLGPDRPDGPVLCWDWRKRTAKHMDTTGEWLLDLEPLDWAYFVLAPVLGAGIAIVGDAALFATAGRTRIARVTAAADGVSVVVLGAGESVTVTGWADAPLGSVTAGGGGVTAPVSAERDPATGVWDATVLVPPRGWVELRVR
jgi:hypothetical protein